MAVLAFLGDKLNTRLGAAAGSAVLATSLTACGPDEQPQYLPSITADQQERCIEIGRRGASNSNQNVQEATPGFGSKLGDAVTGNTPKQRPDVTYSDQRGAYEQQKCENNARIANAEAAAEQARIRREAAAREAEAKREAAERAGLKPGDQIITTPSDRARMQPRNDAAPSTSDSSFSLPEVNFPKVDAALRQRMEQATPNPLNWVKRTEPAASAASAPQTPGRQ